MSIEFELFEPFYSSTPEHLGQRSPDEIVALLAEIPIQVEALIGNVDEQLLTTRPSTDEWSVKEIVGHIIEVEALFFQRVTHVLEVQGTPAIDAPMAPWLLHEGKGYESLTAPELVERLAETRAATLALLSGLETDQWTRQGLIGGGAVSILDLGTWLTNHDIGHLAQIKRYVPEST